MMMMNQIKNQQFCSESSYEARLCGTPDLCSRSSQSSLERPGLKRPCSAEVVSGRNWGMSRHRSGSDPLFTRKTIKEQGKVIGKEKQRHILRQGSSNDMYARPSNEHRWSKAACDDGHVYSEVGKIFEEDCYFPSNVTFASRTLFKGACFFGAGSTFESRCTFEKACFFGPYCVFDSSCIFKMPCAFNQACAFGKACQTAQNSMFSTDCKILSEKASIIEITPKTETSGFKDDIIKKLERNPKCVLCKKRNKSHILQPCGHMVVCKQCSKKESISNPGTGQCPVCRQRVEKVQKVIAER